MDDSNQSAVEKTVREFIGKNPAVKSNHVEMDMSLKDLNIDSLEKLSIGMDLEDEYSIEFTDEEIEEFATVSDVVTAVETALTAKTEAQVASTPPQQSQHKTNVDSQIRNEHFAFSYNCKNCGKGFSQKSNLDRHKRSHIRVRAF